MTLSTTTSLVTYTANGVTSSFAVPFRFLENSHLVVSVKAVGGAYVVKTEGVHYSVAGAGAANGGTITFQGGANKPANGSLVKIVRTVPITQLTDLRSQGDFLPGTHEDALDKLTMMVQQLNSGVIDANEIIGGGEANTGTNMGAGAKVYKDKSGVSLRLRSLIAGTGMTVSELADEIQISGNAFVFPWRGSFTYSGGADNWSAANQNGDWFSSISKQAEGRCRLSFSVSQANGYSVTVTPHRSADGVAAAAVTKEDQYVDVYLYAGSLNKNLDFDIVIFPYIAEV